MHLTVQGKYSRKTLERYYLQALPFHGTILLTIRMKLAGLSIRQFIFFQNLIDPGLLSDIKLKTNEIEASLSSEGKRSINLDPGYLTLSNIVLASTKNYAHRIYLGKGIYGEITLIYKDDTYKPHLFTYRDYQDKTHIDIFLKAREILKKMLDKNVNLMTFL